MNKQGITLSALPHVVKYYEKHGFKISNYINCGKIIDIKSRPPVRAAAQHTYTYDFYINNDIRTTVDANKYNTTKNARNMMHDEEGIGMIWCKDFKPASAPRPQPINPPSKAPSKARKSSKAPSKVPSKVPSKAPSKAPSKVPSKARSVSVKRPQHIYFTNNNNHANTKNNKMPKHIYFSNKGRAKTYKNKPGHTYFSNNNN